MRLRLLVSTAIGLASGGFCWFLLRHFHQGAGDFNWALWIAQDLIAGVNPYLRATQYYPLPAALFGLPLCLLPPPLAGAIFYGASSGLMAFGLMRESYWHLLVFLAYPYWVGLLTCQWTPLLFACAFFPLLLPATLAKPQIGLPVALTHMSRRGAIACAVVLAISLMVRPHWPLEWLASIGTYDRFIPLLVFPGQLVLLALWRWRDRNAQLLLWMAVMPQRWFYDQLVLWLIPQTRREILFMVALSWVPGIWRWYHTPQSFLEVGRWAVLFIYLPALLILERHEWQERKARLRDTEIA